MARYYVHDLESDKLELHTAGKADWQSLPEELRNRIKRAFLWSNRRNCWASRTKGGINRIWFVKELTAAGFEDRGEQGERLTFAEQIERQQERAEDRADRMSERARKADQEATARFNSHANQTLSAMQGEPVKVGHHSEKRHRRLIEKAWADMGAGAAAIDKRDHYRQRAETALATASGAEYRDRAYLDRRIHEQEAERRKLISRIEQTADTDENAAYLDRLADAVEEIDDKLGFYRACLEAIPQGWTKETLKGMTHVKIRGRWEEIVKLNPTTVAVPNICFNTPETQRRWALKYRYAEIQDARKVEAPTAPAAL